jgi:hypothetical protein
MKPIAAKAKMVPRVVNMLIIPAVDAGIHAAGRINIAHPMMPNITPQDRIICPSWVLFRIFDTARVPHLGA